MLHAIFDMSVTLKNEIFLPLFALLLSPPEIKYKINSVLLKPFFCFFNDFFLLKTKQKNGLDKILKKKTNLHTKVWS